MERRSIFLSQKRPGFSCQPGVQEGFRRSSSEEDDPKRKFLPEEHTMAKRCLTLVRLYFFMSLYALGPFSCAFTWSGTVSNFQCVPVSLPTSLLFQKMLFLGKGTVSSIKTLQVLYMSHSLWSLPLFLSTGKQRANSFVLHIILQIVFVSKAFENLGFKVLS